jgi:hypothetical protein
MRYRDIFSQTKPLEGTAFVFLCALRQNLAYVSADLAQFFTGRLRACSKQMELRNQYFQTISTADTLEFLAKLFVRIDLGGQVQKYREIPGFFKAQPH